MKKKDQNMGQVEARSTNHFAGLGTAFAVVLLAISLSSFSLYKKAEVSLAQTCFEYTGADNPTDAQATNPSLYASETSSIICPLEIETLCGLCFEEGDFELDASGQPLFRYPITNQLTPLGEVVMANWNNLGAHDQPIIASNGNEVTLLFRDLK